MGGGAPSWMPGKKQIDKATKATRKVAAEVFEEVIEKPTKKIAAETYDVTTGSTKEDRRPPPEPEITPEVTPEVVPDDTMLGRGTRRTKGKRSGAGGTLMEGFGVAYAKPSSKSPTGG